MSTDASWVMYTFINIRTVLTNENKLRNELLNKTSCNLSYSFCKKKTNDDQRTVSPFVRIPKFKLKKTSTNDCFPLLGIIQVILCPSLIDLNQPWRFCTIGKIQAPWSALYVITPNDTQVRGDNGETWWAMGTGGGAATQRWKSEVMT